LPTAQTGNAANLHTLGFCNNFGPIPGHLLLDMVPRQGVNGARTRPIRINIGKYRPVKSRALIAGKIAPALGAV
jgi:hypothetical protein